MKRCDWCMTEEIVRTYHDEEWGVPLHDDQRHFEYLSMEVMQCGLNWTLMLKKREIFLRCFDGFDFHRVANYTEEKIQEILATPGMIRSRRKVEAIVGNARRFLELIEEYGSFDAWLWSFTQGETYVYRTHQQGQWVASNALSDAVSKALRQRGFKYLGSITVYSHLQACGMINDHAPDCWRYEPLLQQAKIRVIE